MRARSAGSGLPEGSARVELRPSKPEGIVPARVAAIAALEGDQQCVADICDMYRSRRDVLCEGLSASGWQVSKPRATMFVWAELPEAYRAMGSLEFSKKLLKEAKIAVSPGVGFGEFGEGFVRFGLIENEHRTRQAIRNVKRMFRDDGLIAA